MNRISNIKIAEPVKPDYPADLNPIVFGMKPEKKNYLHERKLVEQPTYSQIAYMAYEQNRELGEAFASASSGPDGHTEAFAKSNE